MYECEKCGGELTFDIPSQRLSCSHCGGSFEPGSYGGDLYADAAVFTVNEFQCPHCGGNITAANLSMIEYCPYCGRAALPLTEGMAARKPDGIVPFTLTCGDAKEAYRKAVRKNPFAPSLMKDESFLEGFHGIYLPFWSYDVRFKERPSFRKNEVYIQGNYEYTDHFELSGDMQACYEGITYDASSLFDDVMGQAIVPFHREGSRPFNPSYLFGFYAERQDVDPEIYRQEAVETATRGVFGKFSGAFPGEGLRLPGRWEDREEAFGAEVSGVKYTMFPVWFLTWRRKKDVAYAVVNGQTGAVYADIPASYAKVLAAAAIMSVPFFLLWYFVLPSLSIYTMLLLASVCAVWAMEKAVELADRTVEREGRINGRRAFIRQSRLEHGRSLPLKGSSNQNYSVRRKKKKQKKDAKEVAGHIFFDVIGGFFTALMTLWYVVLPCIGLLIFLCSSILAMGRRNMRTGCYILLAVTAVCRILTMRKDKALYITVAGPAVALAASMAVHFINPVNDLWFYGAGAVTAAGLAVSLILLVRQCNHLAVHPDPLFSGGKAGQGEGGAA